MCWQTLADSTDLTDYSSGNFINNPTGIAYL